MLLACYGPRNSGVNLTLSNEPVFPFRERTTRGELLDDAPEKAKVAQFRFRASALLQLQDVNVIAGGSQPDDAEFLDTREPILLHSFPPHQNANRPG
jgi:hypothetical protein